jgi:hypothetical protein
LGKGFAAQSSFGFRDHTVKPVFKHNVILIYQGQGLLDAVKPLPGQCFRVYYLVKRGFRAAHLEKVKLQETSQNSFEYAGRAELRA